jgi:hypothetical protein
MVAPPDPVPICASCGVAMPGVRGFEPCPHCGRVYEPKEEGANFGDVFLAWRDRWRDDPPVLLLLILAAAAFGDAYFETSWRVWGYVAMGGFLVMAALGKLATGIVARSAGGERTLAGRSERRRPPNRND